MPKKQKTGKESSPNSLSAGEAFQIVLSLERVHCLLSHALSEYLSCVGAQDDVTGSINSALISVAGRQAAVAEEHKALI